MAIKTLGIDLAKNTFHLTAIPAQKIKKSKFSKGCKEVHSFEERCLRDKG